MTHIKKVSMMKNGKHIVTNRRRQRAQSQTCLSYAERQGEKADRLKQKFPRLSNLHIVWIWTKRLTLVGLLVAVVWAVINSGVGFFLAVVVGFLLIRLAFRVIVTVVYIILIALILGLIIL